MLQVNKYQVPVSFSPLRSPRISSKGGFNPKGIVANIVVLVGRAEKNGGVYIDGKLEPLTKEMVEALTRELGDEKTCSGALIKITEMLTPPDEGTRVAHALNIEG